MESGMFQVEGAELYYEKRGRGPELLLISGAGGDAGYYSRLADDMADAFTVVNYDRRANSRSSGRTEIPMTVAQQADDAKALIDGLLAGKALVFGNSAGGITALELAVRHPDAIHGLIAHEPPAVRVLPTNDPSYDFFDKIAGCYAEGGVPAAGPAFVATVRGEYSYAYPEGVLERLMGNMEQLFRWEWSAWGSFTPDFEALQKAPFPILLGAGSSDRGLYYARPSVEIARRIGAPWAEFPGIHMDFIPRPQLFGAALRLALTQMHTTVSGVPDLWAKSPFGG